ncbi:hypothetical protein [Labilibaculum antarcticum]|uniref:Uncharacterized protein n=1 Tax=Labilibaculum antarcticum TaxID=1717717 RepID=A0A1Y1CNF9_9BACT|nr:hypothetical protein [Labilibaculum antarcticum]BAX81979.1 hypothetical protein ALGA_3687 [Labilibaculum antarcticum]
MTVYSEDYVQELFSQVLKLDYSDIKPKLELTRKDETFLRNSYLKVSLPLKQAININTQNLNVIPENLQRELLEICIDWLNRISLFSEKSLKGFKKTNKEPTQEEVESYMIKFHNFSNNLAQTKFFNLILTIKLYANEPELSSIKEIEDLINSKLPNLKESERDSNSIKSLLNELQKQTKKHITSDYALIFQRVWEKHQTYSHYWLSAGIITAIVFILTLSFGAFDSLKTENMSDSGVFINYNLGNIVARVLIIAIQVFFMSFSFKQYSVNKHLQNVNRHRANAFESYQLFDSILPKDDEIHRNELMLQLAKAIYEQGSTGYLSEKSSNFNLSLTEITKMLGTTK